MNTPVISSDKKEKSTILVWKIIQILMWLVGVVIVFCLLFYPVLGIHLFWNILIPVAPLLLVVATGLWRNICPMASTALFPRHINISKRIKLTTKHQEVLSLVAIFSLFLIVPLRHIVFNTNGFATAVLILSIGIVAFTMGIIFDWKSGWCSSLCPIHPVEKLYGNKAILKLKNAHCNSCVKCVTPCPDTTLNIQPFSSKKSNYQKISKVLLIGGFPGFIWGWFQVPDYNEIITIENFIESYKLPMVGLFTTSTLFFLLTKILTPKKQLLTNLYSFAAVACYYWFRLPALVGFGMFKTDGMLIDLAPYLPEEMIKGSIIVSSIFFFWWLVLKKQTKKSWLIRPVYKTI